MAEVQLIDAKEQPICPHCEQELTVILKTTKGIFERHVIYMCGNCKKVLSIGNDMGFGS